MKKIIRFVLSAGMLAGLMQFGADADAAGAWVFQAGAGHLWPGGGSSALSLFDGHVCVPSTSPQPSGSWTWVVPVQLSTTAATTYTGTQYTSTSLTATVASRLVSFNTDGTVAQAKAATTDSAIGTAAVPANGTLFVQSQLTQPGCSSGFFCGTACLEQVKVTY